VISLDVVGVGIGILTVFAGVIGIGLGFGSQTLVANFIAGLILLVTRRISVEDVIEVEGQVGRVLRIGSFSTAVRTLENLEVVVPNSLIIESSVTNWTRGGSPVRLAVEVASAYGSDVALVRRLLLQVAHEDPRVLENPAPLVRFDSFGDSGLVFTLAPWIEDPEERLMVSSDLRFRIDRAFREHDVEIPFSQQDLHIRAGDGLIKVELSQTPEELSDED
jgi:small-conductance mechanosensitive channel